MPRKPFDPALLRDVAETGGDLQVRAPAAPFVPNEFHGAIFDWLTHGQGSAIINAVAGSGKTTTIGKMLEHLPRGSDAVVLAFSHTTAQDFRDRLLGLDLKARVEALTFHAAGFAAVRQYFLRSSCDVVGNKLREIVKDTFSGFDRQRFGSFVMKLVSVAKAEGFGTSAGVGWKEKGLAGLVDHYGLDLAEDFEDRELRKACGLAYDVLQESNRLAEKGIIDFDDQLYLVALWDLTMPRYEYVFIDEAQDTNVLRRLVTRKSLREGGRLVAVGDPHQCQPAGTMVECVIKHSKYTVEARHAVPIETVRKGDYVSSFSLRDGRVYARKVLDVASRVHNGEVITIATPETESRYTHEHRCLIRNRGNVWCVYVMQRHGRYRIGMCRLNHRYLGAGPLLRMRHEDADAVWILDTYKDRRQALTMELTLSAQFHLPQLMFTAKPVTGCLFTQGDLDGIWATIGNNELEARACLRAFGRYIQYPYFVRGQRQGTFRRPHYTQACNVLPESEVLLRNGRWTVATVNRAQFVGEVWSLAVDKEQTYFADGICTHNSIYGFTGASHDALDQIQDEFNAVPLPLSVNYRCDKAIIALAQTIVPEIQPRPDAGLGHVYRDIALQDVIAQLTTKDAILCRNNAPLVQLVYDLIAQGIGATIQGRDIGKGLIELMASMRAATVEALEHKLDGYRKKEMARFQRRGEDAKAASVDDKVECLLTIIDGVEERTLAGVERAITNLFTDDKANVLTLSTIHKAKGREWPKVALFRPDLIPAKWAVLPWQEDQERNLLYVAYTRAKETLYIVTPPEVRR